MKRNLLSILWATIILGTIVWFAQTTTVTSPGGGGSSVGGTTFSDSAAINEILVGSGAGTADWVPMSGNGSIAASGAFTLDVADAYNWTNRHQWIETRTATGDDTTGITETFITFAPTSGTGTKHGLKTFATMDSNTTAYNMVGQNHYATRGFFDASSGNGELLGFSYHTEDYGSGVSTTGGTGIVNEFIYANPTDQTVASPDGFFGIDNHLVSDSPGNITGIFGGIRNFVDPISNSKTFSQVYGIYSPVEVVSSNATLVEGYVTWLIQRTSGTTTKGVGFSFNGCDEQTGGVFTTCYGLEIDDTGEAATGVGIKIQAQSATGKAIETDAADRSDLGNVYFTDLNSLTANAATGGKLNFANNEGILWRNAANSANLTLKTDASNNLFWNGAGIDHSNTAPVVALRDTDLSVPFSFTTNGRVAVLSEYGTSSGGLNVQGSSVSERALNLQGLSGSTSPTEGVINVDCYKHNGSGGAVAIAATEKCFGILNAASEKGYFRGDGGIVVPSYHSVTNCSDSAGDAACTAAPAGSVVIDAADTNTVVSTTAVTANSQIFVMIDASLGTRLSVTCNTQAASVFNPRITARTAGTSFTVTVDAGPTTNPLCLSYFIVN